MSSFQGPGRPRKQGGPWTTAENQRLQRLVSRFANQAQVHWVEIAREHGTRDAKQCRERWDNHLKPGVNREKISDREGADLTKWVRQHGKHWAPLGRALNRPENMVKNYWYQEHKKKERGVRQRGHDSRRVASHEPPVSSAPMSRDNSSSSHQTYGVSPRSPAAYVPAYEYNHPAAPYYPSGPPHPQYQFPSRRASITSIITNPPSLASDHGSPVESPRAAAEIPYPPGQFALPPYHRQPEITLLSPQQLLETAKHKRTLSASSHGSFMALPPSPTSPSVHIRPSAPASGALAYGDVPRYSGDGHAFAYSTANADHGLANRHHQQHLPQHNAEPRTSNARSGSDGRISISSLIS